MEGNKYSSFAFLGVLTSELETHLYKKQFQLIPLVQLLQKASQKLFLKCALRLNEKSAYIIGISELLLLELDTIVMP